jgi:UDP-N-acetylglucosamine 4,6-dehydratase
MGRCAMKKILITGGAGTVGSSFINEYYNDYKFYNVSRNEAQITNLKRRFPDVKSFLADICDLDLMINIFEQVQPDIVIHAAALKHINLAEENSSRAIEINVVGSLNIIKASIRAQVPLTVGISTDKACNPDSVYGYSKRMMETMFMQHHNEKTKFICTRFANVANSNGSVIPFWLAEAEKGNKLKLTDPNMNRLMFTKKASAELIWMAMTSAVGIESSFILCKVMKTVNMLNLANVIGDGVDIIGKRPGEKLDEILISEKELPYTSALDNGYVYILPNKQEKNLTREHSSANAEIMTEKEMKELIWQE